MLKVGAFQFSGSGDIDKNLAAITRGIKQAADQNVRLLLTQECALCGYPPLELASVDALDVEKQREAFRAVVELSKQHDMYIALGMIRFEDDKRHNSMVMIQPDGRTTTYHKRALWGWGLDNFVAGEDAGGVVEIDGIKVGMRICYEVRFPEYFRELFCGKVDLALVSFVDVGNAEQAAKLDVIKSHLVSRAVENVMYVLSANTLSQHQLAPTCLINPDGKVLGIAPLNEEALLIGEITEDEPNFGQKGRIVQSELLIKHYSCS